jgi:hypothetical protein
MAMLPTAGEMLDDAEASTSDIDAALAAACDAVLPDACSEHPYAVFSAPLGVGCGSAACHGEVGSPPVAGLDLASDSNNLAARLAQASGTGRCSDFMAIDIANPESSLLITKLSDTPPCGAGMPPIGGLTEAERTCIVQWVLAVADCLSDGS